MGHEGLVRLVRPMNTTDRILGESVRPPTEKELTSPRSAYFYAVDVIKVRWPEGEPVMAKDPEYAYYYAVNIIDGRWPEAEEAIANDPDFAYFYATDVIEGRWPEGEPAIATDPRVAERYIKRFPEAKREWVMRGWLDWFDL